MRSWLPPPTPCSSKGGQECVVALSTAMRAACTARDAGTACGPAGCTGHWLAPTSAHADPRSFALPRSMCCPPLAILQPRLALICVVLCLPGAGDAAASCMLLAARAPRMRSKPPAPEVTGKQVIAAVGNASKELIQLKTGHRGKSRLHILGTRATALVEHRLETKHVCFQE